MGLAHSVRMGGKLIVFVAASHQTGLDTRSKARRPIKVGIKGRERIIIISYLKAYNCVTIICIKNSYLKF